MSVSHLQTKAFRGECFVLVRGGTVFTTVYRTLESVGWYRAARKLLPASLTGRSGLSIVFTSSNEISFCFPACLSLVDVSDFGRA